MTKIEYLELLGSELKKNNVADMADILSEYEQHFAFKLADGHSEEEIAARLGAPRTIAAQFDSAGEPQDTNKGKYFIRFALFFAALVETLFLVLFLAWDLVVAASALALAVLGVCLVGGMNIVGLIPYMPYLGSLLFGISVLGLALIFGGASYYCFAFLRQMIRAIIRWHKNMVSASALPPLAWHPQFQPKTRRTIRTIMLWAVIVFGIFFVIADITLMLEAGTMGFWHHWNWFVG